MCLLLNYLLECCHRCQLPTVQSPQPTARRVNSGPPFQPPLHLAHHLQMSPQHLTHLMAMFPRNREFLIIRCPNNGRGRALVSACLYLQAWSGRSRWRRLHQRVKFKVRMLRYDHSPHQCYLTRLSLRRCHPGHLSQRHQGHTKSDSWDMRIWGQLYLYHIHECLDWRHLKTATIATTLTVGSQTITICLIQGRKFDSYYICKYCVQNMNVIVWAQQPIRIGETSISCSNWTPRKCLFNFEWLYLLRTTYFHLTFTSC